MDKDDSIEILRSAGNYLKSRYNQQPPFWASSGDNYAHQLLQCCADILELETKISCILHDCETSRHYGIFALEISGLSAMAWHLEQGYDNANIGREAMAKALRSVENRLASIVSLLSY